MISLENKRQSLLKSLAAVSKYAGDVPSNAEIHDIQTRIEEVENIWKDFREIQISIENSNTCPTRGQLAEEEGVMNSSFEAYLNCKSILRGHLNRLTPSTSMTPPINNNNPINPPIAPNPKLTEMPIPKFDGDYENWESFRDLFVSIIHNQDNLSGSRKLQYLKASLVGEAQKLISSFTICDANYIEAWDAISERYNNPRVLIDAIMKKIIEPTTQ